jgi:hypothetical protein
MATMVSTMPAAAWVALGDTAAMRLEAEPVERSPISNHAIAKTFRAALLLTGGVRQAEAAMSDAIRRMDREHASDEAFLLDCVRASVARGRQSKATAEDAEGASAILAPELKRILFLAPHLRQGLVLRVLLGLSDDDCARLNIRNASQCACAAVRELARIRETERAMMA